MVNGVPRPVRADGAQERTRTSTPLRALAPEASASTNSATWAARGRLCMSKRGARQLESAAAACRRPAVERRGAPSIRGSRHAQQGGDGLRRLGLHRPLRRAAPGRSWGGDPRPDPPPERAIFLKPLGAVGQINLERWNPTAPGEADRQLVGADAAVSLDRHPVRAPRRRLRAAAGRLPGEIGAAARRTASGVWSMSRRSAPTPLAGRLCAAPRPPARRVKAGFPQATILRPSIVFGPEDSFFNRFARMAQISPVLPLIGGGRTRFQPVYVGDVAEAVVAG